MLSFWCTTLFDHIHHVLRCERTGDGAQIFCVSCSETLVYEEMTPEQLLEVRNRRLTRPHNPPKWARETNMEKLTRQARNRAILLTLGIFVVMLFAIGIGQQRRDQARAAAPAQLTGYSCKITKAVALDIMNVYTLANALEDTGRMTKWRYGLMQEFPGCSPALYGAMANWMDAESRGDKDSRSAAEDQLLDILR